jgi:hypothetical protein
MAENPRKTSKPGSGPGGLLGALGLSPKALLLVTLLALLVWWYYQNLDMTLTTTETAVVVLGLALAVAAGRAAWSLLQRLRTRAPGKPGGTLK